MRIFIMLLIGLTHLSCGLWARKRIGSSYPKDVYTRGCDGVVNDKHRIHMLKGLQSHAKGNGNELCNDEREYCLVTFAPQPVSSDDMEVSEGSQCRPTGLNNSRNGLNDIEVQTQLFRSEISKKYGQVSKYGPSRVTVSSGVSDVGEPGELDVDHYKCR